MHQSCWRKGR